MTSAGSLVSRSSLSPARFSFVKGKTHPRLAARPAEYLQMLNLGWFAGRRVELLGGEVLEMPAQFDLHLAAIDLTAAALQSCFGAGFWVRRQGSLDLSPYGIPDPDVAVVAGRPHGAGRTIATGVLLVVEVSDSSLGLDRHAKGSLYAAASLTDYWIVNLVQRQLEVHRDPGPDAAALYGASFATRVILDPGDSVTPLAVPQGRILVADLLP